MLLVAWHSPHPLRRLFSLFYATQPLCCCKTQAQVRAAHWTPLPQCSPKYRSPVLYLGSEAGLLLGQITKSCLGAYAGLVGSALPICGSPLAAFILLHCGSCLGKLAVVCGLFWVGLFSANCSLLRGRRLCLSCFIAATLLYGRERGMVPPRAQFISPSWAELCLGSSSFSPLTIKVV